MPRLVNLRERAARVSNPCGHCIMRVFSWKGEPPMTFFLNTLLPWLMVMATNAYVQVGVGVLISGLILFRRPRNGIGLLMATVLTCVGFAACSRLMLTLTINPAHVPLWLWIGYVSLPLWIFAGLAKAVCLFFWVQYRRRT